MTFASITDVDVVASVCILVSVYRCMETIMSTSFFEPFVIRIWSSIKLPKLYVSTYCFHLTQYYFYIIRPGVSTPSPPETSFIPTPLEPLRSELQTRFLDIHRL